MSIVGDETQIVGREEELADIESVILSLQDGVGNFRGYGGEPGIGKTEMLRALARSARQAGVVTLWARPGELERLLESALAAQAEGGKVAVLVDDLHKYVDGAVPTLVRLMELTGEGMLLAVAFRPRQLSLGLTAGMCPVSSHSGTRRLAPMTFEQTTRLLGPRPDLETIHHAAQGIPLYAQVLADSSPTSSAQLMAELAILPPDELAVAQAAAVIGGPFVQETLFAVCELDPETTRAALDSLVALDIVRLSRPGPLLAFRHETLATAVYGTTPLSRRSVLHLRADRDLERRGAPAIMRAEHVAHSFDPAQPDRHLTLALGARQALDTDPATAIGWLEAAEARLARSHPHWSQTQLLLAKARLYLGRLDDSRATFLTLTNGSASEGTEAVLHTGRIERLLGRYPEATALIRKGLTRTGSTAAHAVGLYELSAIAAESSEYGDSDRLATEAARLARAAGDQLQECLALAGAAWARISLGDTDRASEATARAAWLVDAIVDSVAVQDIECLRMLGQSELMLDRLFDARRHLSRGVRLARRTGQRHVLPNLLKCMAELEFRFGRLDRASRVLDEAEPMSEQTGVIAIRTLTASLRANTLLWQRSMAAVEEAVAAGERAAHFAAGADSTLTWGKQAQAALGEALVFAGQPGPGSHIMLAAGGGHALALLAPHRRVRWWEILTIAAVADSDLARADEYATMAVEAVNRAPTEIRRGFAHRARALVYCAKGATEEALGDAEIAVESFTAAGALLDLGRTHVLMAGIGIDAGRVDEVTDLLAVARGIASRCHSERLREQVDAQLARLSAKPSAEPTAEQWHAPLTPRERDIAELAGQALPSTAIAAQLHLSVRTVDSHLGRIYRKLGVTNRVALANLLNRQ